MNNDSADFRRLIDDVKGRMDIVDEMGKRGVRLVKRGATYTGNCPFHDDRSPSFVVRADAQTYRCYAGSCGAHGDVLDFIQHHDNVTLMDILEAEGALAPTGHQPDKAVKPPVPRPERKVLQVVTPVPEDADGLFGDDHTVGVGLATLKPATRRTTPIYNPNQDKFSRLAPSMVFPYRDRDGRLLGYVLRLEFEEDGKRRKITPAVTWCQLPSGRQGWAMQHWQAPWPLYGLDRLAAMPDAPVVVVEGEKAADAGQRLLEDAGFVVMSWCGGTNNTQAADLAPLAGRDVYLWPDADMAGSLAASAIALRLAGEHALAPQLVLPPDGVEPGWDLADGEQEGWDTGMALVHYNVSCADLDTFITRMGIDREKLAAMLPTKAGAAPFVEADVPTEPYLQVLPGGRDAATAAGEGLPKTAAAPSGGNDALASSDAHRKMIEACAAINEARQESDWQHPHLGDMRDATRDLVKKVLAVRGVLAEVDADGLQAILYLRRQGALGRALWMQVLDAVRDHCGREAREKFLADVERLPGEIGAEARRPTQGDAVDADLPVAPDADADGGRGGDEDGTGGGDGGGNGGRRGDNGAAPEGVDVLNLRFLGHRRGRYYFMSRETAEITDMTPADMTNRRLCQLAPLHTWELAFPRDDDGGVDWLAAMDGLVRRSHQVGFFNEDRIRGRGAWIDDGRAVLHLGDRLVIDDRVVDLDAYDGHYIYQRDIPLPLPPLHAPLEDKEAQDVLALVTQLRWEQTLSGWLLAGWIALAPLCGALGWRPHIWLSGGSGSGKSWAMSNIVRPLTGPSAIYIQSSSTEAGIRQYLGADALPILFDEAESEDEHARRRIAQILELMRQASSETGGVIVKGSANQTKRAYQIRSMFALASIGIGLQQQADINRVTVLQLKTPSAKRTQQQKEADGEHFAQLRAAVLKVVSDETALRLFSRMLRLLPVIRDNARTFAAAGQIVFGSQRMGDQMGALIAGAYAMITGERVDLESATAILKQHSWGSYVTEGYDTDHERAWRYLMASKVRVEGANTGSQTFTIGELIDIAIHDTGSSLTAADAKRALGINGIKVDTEESHVVIHNNHQALKSLLADSPWGVNWNNQFQRLEGATKLERTVYFSRGDSSRGVAIPFDYVLAGADDR